MPHAGRRVIRWQQSSKALAILLAAAVTDVASFLPPRAAPVDVRVARVAYSKGGDVHDIDAEVVLRIQGHVERGLIGDAVNEIRKYQDENLPPSIYNSVIEACSSGGADGPKNKRKPQKHDGSDDLIDTANELLSEMGSLALHAHEVVIAGYSRRGRINDALSALSRLEVQLDSDHSNLNPSLSSYQTLLVSLASKNEYAQMNTLLTSMRRRGVRPTVYTFNSLLKVCATSKSPRWREALSLLSQCQREPGVSPDVITYTSTMRALAKGKQARKALDLFRAMKDTGIKPDVFAYTTTMDACAKTNNWKKALQLLEEMKENNVPPNEVTYGVAVNACGNGGQWQTALSLLKTMNDSDMRINSVVYNSAINALSKAARLDAGPDPNMLWKETQHILGEMRSQGVRQDTFTYSSAISVCGSAGLWEEAVRLIHQMKDSGTKGPKRNKIVAFTSAITACANSK